MLDNLSHKLIGFRVKAAREAKGWTQDQLTQGLGLNDRQSVSDIENGKRTLRPEEMLALSDLLDRDIEFFIDPFAVAGEAPEPASATPSAGCKSAAALPAAATTSTSGCAWTNASAARAEAP